MALKAVFFDVGETLVDEERWWRVLAEREGLQPHVVWAALGVTIERGEEHSELWGHLGIDRHFDPGRQVLACVTFLESVVELAGCAADEVAYIGDRVDDDVLPAAAPGLLAVHVRRGPWGRLQRTPPEAAVGPDDLASLPDALALLL